MSNWYKFTGDLYVHTNYNSFQSNLGSFGDFNVDNEAVTLLAHQEARERKINQILNEAFGVDLLGFSMIYTDLMKMYRHKTVEKWEELTYMWQGKEISFSESFKQLTAMFNKYGQLSGTYQGMNITQRASHFQLYWHGINDYINKLTDQGFSLEGLEGQHKLFMNQIANFIEAGEKEGGMSMNAINGHVNALKGIAFPQFASVLLNQVFFAIQKGASQSTDLKFTIKGEGKVADLSTSINDKEEFNFSLKNITAETLSGRGAKVFSGTIESVIELLAQVMMNKNQEGLDYLKYYLINISRMKSKSMTKQGGVKPDIRLSPEAHEKIKTLVNTYITYYIGRDVGGSGNEVLDKIRQVDVLMGYDFMYPKSLILRFLTSKPGEVFNTSYEIRKGAESGPVEAFDIAKRQILFDTRGDYNQVVSEAFFNKMVNQMKSSRATIVLKITAAHFHAMGYHK